MTLIPTMNFRWLVDDDPSPLPMRLQQRHLMPNGRDEAWVDVPIVRQEPKPLSGKA